MAASLNGKVTEAGRMPCNWEEYLVIDSGSCTKYVRKASGEVQTVLQERHEIKMRL